MSSHFNNTARLSSVLIWMLKYSRFTVSWPESLIETVSGEVSNFHSGSAKQYEPQRGAFTKRWTGNFLGMVMREQDKCHLLASGM